MIYDVIALGALLLAIALFVVAIGRSLRKHRLSGTWEDNAEGGPSGNGWTGSSDSGGHHGGGFEGGGGHSAGGGAGGGFDGGGDH